MLLLWWCCDPVGWSRPLRLSWPNSLGAAYVLLAPELRLLRLRVRSRAPRVRFRLVRPRASRCNPWPLRRGGLPLPHVSIPPLFFAPCFGPLAALLMV